jgi:hypothetical protein
MNNQEKLIKAIESGFIPEDVCGHILTLCGDFSKGGLMRIAYNEEEQRKVDSAYPQPYADKIRELCPSWNGQFHVYDYNVQTFGSMENVAEKAILKIWDGMNR